MIVSRFERVLFVNPPYGAIGVKESVSNVSVVLSLAMLAGITRMLGSEVRILDMNLFDNDDSAFRDALLSFSPHVVGITFTTPLSQIAKEYAKVTKSYLGKDTIAIGGGPHATALPEETLNNGLFDAILRGEGEAGFALFLQNGSFEGIKGWSYKKNGSLFISEIADMIDNLDDLPFGAFDLFDAKRYKYPLESARENPVCLLETSRGCYARCIFCNKNIFGYKIRFKSPTRIIDEIEFILSQGFREIHLADDSFTANLDHASAVCDEIIKRKLDFPWVPRSGIRVDRISSDLLDLMRRAGCYHIPFGIESGDQKILDSIKKGITIDQIRIAVSMAKSAGMETTGYFMFGLPGETIETIQRTIDFALELKLNHVKFGVAIPLPGTPFFDSMSKEGRIKTRDWRKFTYSSYPWDVYDHPSLGQDVLEKLTFAGSRLVDIANSSIHFNN
jgi:anaerobic magnesium-protoporphyrin IX monomethyl ester cyclase